MWTTTPWTLPANVAAAVLPDAEYGRTAEGEWWAVERLPDAEFVERVRGEELVGRPYRGPFDHLAAAAEVEHRVIPWDEVSLDGRHGHRPHRARRGLRGLRARPRPRAARPRADRRVGHLLRHVRAARRAFRRARRRSRSSRRFASRACSWRPDGSFTATRRAGAARPRCSSASSTTGSSPPRRSGSRCSTPTRPSSGRRPSTRSAWTTGCATWATGTSPASGTSACRCPSIRVRAAT